MLQLLVSAAFTSKHVNAYARIGIDGSPTDVYRYYRLPVFPNQDTHNRRRQSPLGFWNVPNFEKRLAGCWVRVYCNQKKKEKMLSNIHNHVTRSCGTWFFGTSNEKRQNNYFLDIFQSLNLFSTIVWAAPKFVNGSHTTLTIRAIVVGQSRTVTRFSRGKRKLLCEVLYF